MLFNWGHTWEHIGARGRAELAYRAVITYLPSHVRARSALACRAYGHLQGARKLEPSEQSKPTGWRASQDSCQLQSGMARGDDVDGSLIGNHRTR